jgi:hypothetical protein
MASIFLAEVEGIGPATALLEELRHVMQLPRFAVFAVALFKCNMCCSCRRGRHASQPACVPVALRTRRNVSLRALSSAMARSDFFGLTDRCLGAIPGQTSQRARAVLKVAFSAWSPTLRS